MTLTMKQSSELLSRSAIHMGLSDGIRRIQVELIRLRRDVQSSEGNIPDFSNQLETLERRLDTAISSLNVSINQLVSLGAVC